MVPSERTVCGCAPTKIMAGPLIEASMSPSPRQPMVVVANLAGGDYVKLHVQVAEREELGAQLFEGGRATFLEEQVQERAGVVDVDVDLTAEHLDVRSLRRRGEDEPRPDDRDRPVRTEETERRRAFDVGGLDEVKEREFSYPKPRLIATWQANETDQLRASIAREVAQLDFAEFGTSINVVDESSLIGNPDLEPEKTWRARTEWEHTGAARRGETCASCHMPRNADGRVDHRALGVSAELLARSLSITALVTASAAFASRRPTSCLLSGWMSFGFPRSIVHTIPVQLLAYHAALARGTDVDKPRNLAKSVTVE